MATDIQLYSSFSPNGWKASITLDELGLNWELKEINIFTSQEHKEPWFLEMNPNGKIPVLKDGETAIFESGAILLYLADKYDKDYSISFPHGSKEYYQMLSWIFFHIGDQLQIHGQAVHFRCYAPVRSSYAIELHAKEAARVYGVLDKHLAGKEYMVANKYSLADIAIYPYSRIVDFIDIDLDDFPNVKAWHERISARGAVQSGISKPAPTMGREAIRGMFKNMKAQMDARGNTDIK